MYATQNGHILVVKQLIETMHCDILHKDSVSVNYMNFISLILGSIYHRPCEPGPPILSSWRPGFPIIGQRDACLN